MRLALIAFGLLASLALGIGAVALKVGFASRERGKLVRIDEFPLPDIHPLPVESLPACTTSIDLQHRLLMFNVANVSDHPLTYSGDTDGSPKIWTERLINEQWHQFGFLCHEPVEEIVIRSGESVTFNEEKGEMRWPTRFHVRFRNPAGKESDVLVGEYWP